MNPHLAQKLTHEFDHPFAQSKCERYVATSTVSALQGAEKLATRNKPLAFWKIW